MAEDFAADFDAGGDVLDEEAAEGLQLLQQELSLSLLASELHHTSALLGELETVFACDPETLRALIDGPDHGAGREHDDSPTEAEEGDDDEEDIEAFGPDDSFDFYDDVPLRILRQRMAAGCLYFLVQWQACGTSWVAAEDFAYPRVVREFHLRRMGRHKDPPTVCPPPKPKSNHSYQVAYQVQWGHGNYTDFPWHLDGDKLCSALGRSIPTYYTVTRIEKWVNPKIQNAFEGASGGKSILAFHGTPEANLPSIYKQGLCAGGTGDVRVSHGSAYGFGIYTSKTASTALGYADGKLIACAVRIPDVDPQLSVQEFGNIMVIKRPTLILPVYLIHVVNTNAFPPPVGDAEGRIVQPTARQLKRQQYLKEYAVRRGKR